MIARLLHIANSSPPPPGFRRERFYKMKQRILRWFGTEDGHDLQFIEGKTCWSCYGTGEHYAPHDCYKCGGDGWFKPPVWILLKRWKFGEYTFHEPIQRLYRKPDLHSYHKPLIEGYVEHASYPWKDIHRARLILALLFDWRLLWSETSNWRIHLALARKWHQSKLNRVLEEDHDIPF